MTRLARNLIIDVGVSGIHTRASWPWALVVLLACANPTDAPVQEPVHALGGKADAVCRPSPEPYLDMCWPTAHGAAMRRILNAEDRLLAALGDARVDAMGLVEALDQVADRLHDSELVAVDRLRGDAEALASDAAPETRHAFLADAHAGVLDRLIGTFVAAHVVPIAASATAGSADSGGSSSLPRRDVFTPGVRQSLDLLRGQGAFGQLYAFLFEHSGVLEDLPELDDEVFPFSEPREDRARRIIEHYQWAAAGAALISGVEGAIPVAGIVVSFGHRQWMDFRNRMRMGIALAALYGIDVREDLNLLLVASAVMGATRIPEARAAVVASFVLRTVAYLYARSIGATVQSMLARLVRTLLARMTVESARLAAAATARTAASSVSSQVLGLVSFGLSILADAALSSRQIGILGDSVAAAVRPWGSALPTEGAAYCAPEGQICAALMLGDLAWADGELTSSEVDLLAAHLARPVYQDGEWWQNTAPTIAFLAREAGRTAPADRAARRDARDELEGCAREWRSLDEFERLTALSNAYTMILVDGEVSGEEQERYDVMLDAIGDRWGWSGDLRDEHLETMHTALETLLIAPEDLVPEEQAEGVASLTVYDRLPFLTEVSPDAHDTVLSGLDPYR